MFELFGESTLKENFFDQNWYDMKLSLTTLTIFTLLMNIWKPDSQIMRGLSNWILNVKLTN